MHSSAARTPTGVPSITTPLLRGMLFKKPPRPSLDFGYGGDVSSSDRELLGLMGVAIRIGEGCIAWQAGPGASRIGNLWKAKREDVGRMVTLQWPWRIERWNETN